MKNTLSPTAVFSIPVRIYYEDTDAGGVVYYANYLKFFERCRTEWVRSLGCDQAALLRDEGIVFVVRNVSADYLQAGRLDDLLAVTLAVEKLGHTHIVLSQSVCREGTPLVTATVRIVCVRQTEQGLKTAPIPHDLRQKLEPLP
ncbi:MAG: tol-pal system-associated acyl-CoA thioesterase [Zoogloeaceae bacterium]|jgi:acyl-CoA thioester hydrolase|nr:tol-pal system-associated acyl-CoA thioesterase [Zoogloeaceae bacterium]